MWFILLTALVALARAQQGMCITENQQLVRLYQCMGPQTPSWCYFASCANGNPIGGRSFEDRRSQLVQCPDSCVRRQAIEITESGSSSGGGFRQSKWASDTDWDPVERCAGSSKPGTENVRRLILQYFRGMTNGRTYGCTYMNPTRPAFPPYNRGSLSDHADGGAFDAMLPRIGHPIGQQLADFYEKNWDALGVKYIIYNRRINSGSGWGPYSGSNPHVDHVHLSLLPRAAQGLQESDVLAALQASNITPAPSMPSLGGGSRPNVPRLRPTTRRTTRRPTPRPRRPAPPSRRRS